MQGRDTFKAVYDVTIGYKPIAKYLFWRCASHASLFSERTISVLYGMLIHVVPASCRCTWPVCFAGFQRRYMSISIGCLSTLYRYDAVPSCLAALFATRNRRRFISCLCHACLQEGAHVKEWLLERWTTKDALLESFRKEGHFPGQVGLAACLHTWHASSCSRIALSMTMVIVCRHARSREASCGRSGLCPTAQH